MSTDEFLRPIHAMQSAPIDQGDTMAQQESLRHHAPERAILRAASGTACFLALVGFLENFFVVDVLHTRTGSPDAGQSSVQQMFFWLAIAAGDELNAEVVRYLNRLSDLLFILSRGANAGDEPLWEPGRYR